MQLESKYDEIQKLESLDQKEDHLDVFIRLLLDKSALVYVLINIILCIWLAQTIFSSNLSSIPRSIYLISPFFGKAPLSDIQVVSEGRECPEGYELQQLKTFPSIPSAHISHKQMYLWFDQGKQFCIKRVNITNNHNGTTCSLVSCNGYCFKTHQECPITSISRFPRGSFHLERDTSVFQSTQQYQYSISRSSGRAIVGLQSSFSEHCSHDYRYYDEYKNIEKYWGTVLSCGKQGSILSFYSQFDKMSTETFLYNNGLPIEVSQETYPTLQQVELGEVFEINFNTNTKPECAETLQKAKQSENYLFKNPVSPTLTQNLLIVSFIFFFIEIIWLLAYLCVKKHLKQKNFLVLVLAIIELIVISYIYNENKTLFQTEKIVHEISNCIEKDITAANNWNFGIQSSSSFVMVQFISAIFLLFYFLALVIDKCIFGPKSQQNKYYASRRIVERYGE